MSILINILLVIVVIISLLIILLVLMQRPKNEGLGAAFGGGVTENLFGAQTTNVLQKLTRNLGILFFAITLLLSWLYVKQSKGKSEIDRQLKASATPAPATPAPATPNPSAASAPIEAPKPGETPKTTDTPANPEAGKPANPAPDAEKRPETPAPAPAPEGEKKPESVPVPSPAPAPAAPAPTPSTPPANPPPQ
jgi:preprotein translocase subunit SecG